MYLGTQAPRGNKSIGLPELPSQLLRAAVEDARKLDREIYTPQHDVWHRPDRWESHLGGKLVQGDKCIVCLAGAAIARVQPPWMRYDNSQFAVRSYIQLKALDYFRDGKIVYRAGAEGWTGFRGALYWYKTAMALDFSIPDDLPEPPWVPHRWMGDKGEEYMRMRRFRTWEDFDRLLDAIIEYLPELESRGL